MSKILFPHFPLTLFFYFCLFFSFSYAHYKGHVSHCNCDCSCCYAHNNSHEYIPTKPGNSSPAHNNNQEIPTKPGNSSPAHDNSQQVPTNPGKSFPAHNSSSEVPTKPGNSSPAHNNSQEISVKPHNSFPAHNNNQEIPTKPGNSSPAHDNSQQVPTNPGKSFPAHNSSSEVPTKPGNSSPAHNSSNEISTQPGNSFPVQNNHHEVFVQPGNSFPGRNNNHEVPPQPGNFFPVQNNNHEVSAQPGNSFPGQNNHEVPAQPGNSSPSQNNHEVPAQPGNSSPANNSSYDTSTRHNNYIGCFHKVYAFGDSYTDTGNANLVGGLNENFGHISSNSEKSNNGLCDGHLVVDFLCDALKLPHLPPFQSSSVNFTHGANFAIAGSTILPEEDFSTKKITNLFWKGIPLAFQTQIDWFNKLKQQIGCTDKNDNSCKAEMENALFWIGSVGVSDYARIQGSTLSTHWLTEQSVLQVSRLVEAALESGAKYIVVQGLPPIGCLPLHISLCPVKAALDHMGCAAAVNTAVMVHNQILQRRLERFRIMYPNCQILYADYWNAYLTIKMNLKKYNFEEAFKPCCGAAEGPLNFNLHSLCGSPGTVRCNDPSKYISWDGIHLTEAMNRKVTDLFLNQGFCQPSFSELVKSKSGI